MIVCATRNDAEVSEIIFTGTRLECRDFAKDLNKSEYYDIHICQNNGTIEERIKVPRRHRF